MVGAGLCSARQDAPILQGPAAHTYALPCFFVGADDSVRPQDAAVFRKCTANSNAAARFAVGADVGIGPYRMLYKFESFQRADRVVGPYSASPHKPPTLSRASAFRIL